MTAVYFSLASGNFGQNWTNTGLITANDDWSGVPSIIGYLGDYSTGSPNPVDPRTLTAAAATTVDVIANQTNPDAASAPGGVAEFHLANPTIALNGSGTADAPNIVIHLDATARQNITVSFNVRDLDASADNAVQQVALQYRTSDTGVWMNVPGGYVADATSPGSATLVTAVNAALPADAANAATLQLRIITTNAAGNDEWVGIDDIVVTSQPLVVTNPGILSIADASLAEGDAGTAAMTFTVNRNGGTFGDVSATYTISFPANANASDLAPGHLLTGTVSFVDGQTSATITVQVAGDIEYEPNETFAVTLSAPQGGATLGDASATGTILNNDPVPSAGGVFINEIHYDNTSTDVGEAVEIAGPAGTSLAGWSLVTYNGNGGGTDSTIPLSGTFPNQDDGYGTLSFPVPGFQNGAPDGIALVNNLGQVVQFLSYEGSFIATNGPAAGLTSTDIGVAEEPVPGVGFSLQLTGSGANYEDFSWTGASDDNFGQVNTGQNFIGANAAGEVTIADRSIVEGDSGTQQMVFTVRRAGGLNNAAGVDWVLDLSGSADSADLGPGQPLSGHIDFGVGVSSVQISVAIAGDTVGEPNDTFQILLVNPTGNITITDGAATGTILNNDPIALTIMQIQGEAHRSAYEGQPIVTNGIVTAVASNGFYLQDAAGDGNARTSDALFVFTGAAPGRLVGDAVQVTGTVSEFLPGNDATNLTITQVSASSVAFLSGGNPLPAATLIGTGGLTPPTAVIDDDGLASYDPATDGIDFYEALEGMRVTIDEPLVVSQTTGFGETYVVASGGAGVTGLNSRDGVTLSEGDYNPEKIQIDAGTLFPGYAPAHSQGDRLSDVTGIMSYSFNSYEVLVTEAVAVTEDVALSRETTTLQGGRDYLTVASYNVENLSPADGPVKFELLAQNIVYNLAAPDIIGLQEIQDANGINGSDPLSGVVTAQILIAAIAAIGGPNYVYVEIAPSSAGSTGGEPGGNIRNGYLYNADRVDYVDGSAQLIEDPAFNGSRRPLVADFTFNGETVSLINVHFTSRIGSDPLWGSTQPAADAGDAARTAQAQAVSAYVNDALTGDPSLHFGVLGDFNGFYFEDAVGALEAGDVFADLHRLLPETERYSYMFDGNLQAIDHMLVTGGLRDGASFDAVHINAEQADDATRATDHDPILGRFFIEHPNEAPFDLVLDDDEIDENAPAGTLVGTFSADDPDGDVLAYTLVDDAEGRFELNSGTGALTSTAPFDHEAQASYTIVVRATDPEGEFVERTIEIAVADLNEAPTAAADAVAVDEDATTPNLWDHLLGNDSDPDAGASLSIDSVDDTGTLGSLEFDPDSETLRYVADHDSFDALAPGASVVDTFAYTVTDEHGLTSTATVSVTVTGVADGVTLHGGNGKDTLTGTEGEDYLNGGNGVDTLYGLGGHDLLVGGNGNDSLYGGNGNDALAGGHGGDYLEGGSGADLFVFGKGGGEDVITDFEVGVDRLVLQDGIGVKNAFIADVDQDGEDDLVIAFTNGGGAVALLGVTNFGAVGFAGPEALDSYPPF